MLTSSHIMYYQHVLPDSRDFNLWERKAFLRRKEMCSNLPVQVKDWLILIEEIQKLYCISYDGNIIFGL